MYYDQDWKIYFTFDVFHSNIFKIYFTFNIYYNIKFTFSKIIYFLQYIIFEK